jgi:hypothetical protein
MCLAILNISASALPGDIFYDTKRFVERTQLYLPLGAEDLSEQFRQTRLSEIEALLRQNRDAPVMFTGEVDEIEASSWRIEGLIIDTAAATISPNVQVGDWVEVTGSVANGRLVADDIRLTRRSQPSPTPTSRPTSTSENDNNGRANNSSSSGSDDYRKND